MIRLHALLFVVICIPAFAQHADMMLVKGGHYVPHYDEEGVGVEIQDFYMDITPVTHEQYLKFVNAHPQWKRSQVPRLFADEHYLRGWGDSGPDQSILKSPVNNVSWFAAKAYCECLGKRLPTVDEWEYAAMADENRRDARKDSVFNQRIIRGYETRGSHTKEVGNSPANYWGLKDLHGLVWEWTLDFNAVILGGESRKLDNTNSTNLWCGGAAINATDLMNYAAFMRYALRSSLKARYSLTSLGFRCVKDTDKPRHP